MSLNVYLSTFLNQNHNQVLLLRLSDNKPVVTVNHV